MATTQKFVEDNRCVATLVDAIDLKKNDRNNAAKFTWESLPNVFRDKVIDLVLAVAEFGDQFSYGSATFESPYGSFQLVKNGKTGAGSLLLADLVEIVPLFVE